MRKCYYFMTAAVFTMVGCGGDNSAEGVNNPDAIALKDWRLVSYGYATSDKIEVLPDSSYLLTFDGAGTVRGTLDCNYFDTNYNIDGGEIAIDPFTVTEMGCSQMGSEPYESEVSFVNNVLYSAHTYSISNNQLTITAIDSSLLLYVFP